jgi:hypothetical protein
VKAPVAEKRGRARMPTRRHPKRPQWGETLIRLLPQVHGLPGGLTVITSDGERHQPLQELTIGRDHLTYRHGNGISLVLVPFDQIAWIELTNLSHPVR